MRKLNSDHNYLSLYISLAVAAYSLLILWLVIRGARKTKSISDYALGSIQFSPYALGLSLAASMTSAATFIINPGFIAYYGLSAYLSLGIVFALSAILSLIFLTKSFRKIGQSIKALTIAQWMGERFKSKRISALFAFTSLLLITFIVLICVGITKILSLSMDISAPIVLFGLIVFVFGYMMFGGANSMVYTNMIQALLMIAVAFILLGSGYDHLNKGVDAFLNELRSIDPQLVSLTNENSPLFRDWFEIIICQIIVGFAVVCQPHIITKSLLLKNESALSKFLWTGILVELLFFSVVFTGLYVRLTFPDLQMNGNPISLDSALSAYVITKFNSILSLFVILGLISAGLSTLEGLIQTLSTTLTQDVIPIFFKSKIKKQVFLNRLTIIALAIITYFISLDQLISPDLSVGIFAQNGVYAYFSAAFIPVLFGMFIKEDIPDYIPLASAITALIVHFSIYYFRIGPYMQEPIRNPAIASSAAIVSAALLGTILLIHWRYSLKKSFANI